MRRQRYVGFLAIAVAVLFVGFGINRVYSYAICTPVLREAMSSFPHYGGLEMAPKPNLGYSSCQVSYEVRFNEDDDVASYYESQLSAHGWRKPEADKLYVEDRGEVMFDPGSIYGVKNGLIYDVEIDQVEKRLSNPSCPLCW